MSIADEVKNIPSEIMDVFDGPEQEAVPLHYNALTPEQREDLEGKCHALWLYHGGETSEWNGTTCDCEWIQGNLNCKLNPF